MWAEQELIKMISKENIPFPMLTDPAGTIGRQYGVFDEALGLDVRGTFIIDPEGILQLYEVLPLPVGRNLNETLRQIQALQEVRKKKGVEVTPVNWRPGKQTLTPGADLVGKVWEVWIIDDDED